MGKPIIRHCMNCQWYCNQKGYYDCQVRYIDIAFSKRLMAWLCRFYKKVEEKDEE